MEQISDATIAERQNMPCYEVPDSAMQSELIKFGKSRIIGFIDNEPLLQKEGRVILETEQKNFEDNFIRVYTSGNGLCTFHLLGVQNTFSPAGVAATDPARTFPYLELTDKRVRL